MDVQEEMVERTQKRLEKHQSSNASTWLTDGSTLPFKSDTFDCAFLVAVLGEVEDPTAMVSELHRVLKAGSLLSITELAGDPDELTLTGVQDLVEPFGFRLDKRFEQRSNFTVDFLKD